MPERTTDNCKYIKRCGEPGRDSNGKCMGFSRVGDDEPIEVCKRCVYCTVHEEEYQRFPGKPEKGKEDGDKSF